MLMTTVTVSVLRGWRGYSQRAWKRMMAAYPHPCLVFDVVSPHAVCRRLFENPQVCQAKPAQHVVVVPFMLLLVV